MEQSTDKFPETDIEEKLFTQKKKINTCIVFIDGDLGFKAGCATIGE